jgi:MFS family permease
MESARGSLGGGKLVGTMRTVLHADDAGGASQPGPPRLPRTVRLLGWVSFFADVSSEMAQPVLPLLVVGALGGSATVLGGIEGASACAVALVTGWAGIRSDRRRRRVPLVRAGYALPVLGKAVIALATAWPMALAGRLVDRIGKGLRSSPRDALIADATMPANRGRAFGFHRAMDTAGAVVGTSCAVALLWWWGGSMGLEPAVTGSTDGSKPARILFAIAAAIGLIALALTFLLRDRPAAEGPSDRDVSPRRSLPWSFWQSIAPLLIFALANSSDAFLLLRAHQVGLAPWQVALAYLLFNLTYAATAYPAGALSDRLGRRGVLVVGWGLYAAIYAGFAVTSAAGIWPLMAAYGISVGLTDGVSKALIADAAPADRRGTALGLALMVSGLFALVASLAAGVAWDRFGPAATFWLGAGFALAAAVAMMASRRPGAAG